MKLQFILPILLFSWATAHENDGKVVIEELVPGRSIQGSSGANEQIKGNITQTFVQAKERSLHQVSDPNILPEKESVETADSTLESDERTKRTIGVPYPFSLLFPPLTDPEPEYQIISEAAPQYTSVIPTVSATYPRTIPTAYIPQPVSVPLPVQPAIYNSVPVEAITPLLAVNKHLNPEIASKLLASWKKDKGVKLLFKPIKVLKEKKIAKVGKALSFKKLVPEFLKKKLFSKKVVPEPLLVSQAYQSYQVPYAYASQIPISLQPPAPIALPPPEHLFQPFRPVYTPEPIPWQALPAPVPCPEPTHVKVPIPVPAPVESVHIQEPENWNVQEYLHPMLVNGLPPYEHSYPFFQPQPQEEYQINQLPLEHKFEASKSPELYNSYGAPLPSDVYHVPSESVPQFVPAPHFNQHSSFSVKNSTAPTTAQKLHSLHIVTPEPQS